jgi:hypothetical protein
LLLFEGIDLTPKWRKNRYRHVHLSKDASLLKESLLQDLQWFQVAAASSDGKRSLEQSLRERESNS